ncbi:MAG: hypothetical protein FWC71_07165 [Defluviitaleaceae bacterium]|nr:hypothetical protein [Defluviitaleaceae bacterium]
MLEEIKTMRQDLIGDWHASLLSDMELELVLPVIAGKEQERSQILEIMELKQAKAKEMLNQLFSAMDLLEGDLTCQS